MDAKTLEGYTAEELEKEIERRRVAEIAAAREEIASHKRAIGILEARAKELESAGLPVTPRTVRGAKRAHLALDDDREKMVRALAMGPKTRAQLMTAAGVGFYGFGRTIKTLVADGVVKMVGSRATAVYQAAGAAA